MGYTQREAIRLTADLLAETLQVRREWGPIFNFLKEKNFQPRISYSAKLSFVNEKEIRFLSNKKMLREIITAKPGLHEEKNTKYGKEHHY